MERDTVWRRLVIFHRRSEISPCLHIKVQVVQNCFTPSRMTFNFEWFKKLLEITHVI